MPATPRTPITTRIKVRTMVVSAAFAVVTIMGSIYGASLKSGQQVKSEQKRVAETTVEDRIDILEQQRSRLVKQKVPLEQKLEAVRERIALQEKEQKEKADGR